MDERARIERLEAEVAELKALVRSVAPRSDDDVDQPDRTSRRAVLRMASAAAAGVAVGGVLRAAPVAADGFVFNTAVLETSSPNAVRSRYTGNAVGNSGFVFIAGNQFTNGSNHPAALAGFSSTNSNQSSGVYGYTNNEGGYGVVGYNGDGGTGVYGRAPTGTGARAEGVVALDAVGVTVGARIAGGVGADVDGVTTGVEATASGPTGSGVAGTGGRAGVTGRSGRYSVEALRSTSANLYLQPDNDALGPKAPPPLRTDEHLAGELDDVGGDLWCCVESGTPGRWVKLAGPSTAGAFHAITPARVYDSRTALPSPGVLSSGESRLVSVKDSRSIVDGSVLVTDLVPTGARAVTANVTVVDTLGSGFLAVNPGGTTVVSAATVNWSAPGQILNNGVTLTLNGQRELTVIAGGPTGSGTHVVIDVTGYFR